MRQVPTYLIIGSGRVSQHLQHYFSILGIPYQTWYRSYNTAYNNLITKLKSSTHILLAISDGSIEDFILEHKKYLEDKICIHFSGVLYTKLAYGVHPLMSFSSELYQGKIYYKIPFVLDSNSPDFQDLFPKLDNPHFRIKANQKDKYHMLCVLANNFTTILWEKVFKDFSQDLELPKEVLVPILEQTCNNLSGLAMSKIGGDDSVLTGPIARSDVKTIGKHLDILDKNKDNFHQIYQAFISAICPELILSNKNLIKN